MIEIITLCRRVILPEPTHQEWCKITQRSTSGRVPTAQLRAAYIAGALAYMKQTDGHRGARMERELLDEPLWKS